MTTRAVIFDLWGTLIDESPWAELDSQMAAALEVDRQVFMPAWQNVHGREQTGAYSEPEDALRAVANLLGAPADDGMIAKAVEAYRHNTASELLQRLRPDAEGLLQKIRAAGLRLGLISNCGTMTAELMQQHPLWRYFDFPVLSCKAGVAKPDLAIFRHAHQGLGVAPTSCLYVADGNYGELEAAESLGMRSILIRSNYADLNSFRLSPVQWPGRRISSLTEVLEHLG